MRNSEGRFCEAGIKPGGFAARLKPRLKPSKTTQNCPHGGGDSFEQNNLEIRSKGERCSAADRPSAEPSRAQKALGSRALARPGRPPPLPALRLRPPPPQPPPDPPARFHLGEAEPLPQAPGTPRGGYSHPPRRWEGWPCPRSRHPLGPGSPGGSEPGWPEAPLAAGGCKGHRRDGTAHCSRAAEDVNQHPDGRIRQRAARRAAWPSCTQGTAYQKTPTNRPQTPPTSNPKQTNKQLKKETNNKPHENKKNQLQKTPKSNKTPHPLSHSFTLHQICKICTKLRSKCQRRKRN